MPPYTKRQDSGAIDDGWTVTDGDGLVIAHLDTESMADALIASLSKPGDRWEDDGIQFPRLIAEMEAAGFFTDANLMAALCSSMDLEVDDVMDLIERAQKAWDARKAAL